MPTYQYACTECGHRFEQVQAFTDSSLTECPVCEGRLRKVYGSVGVVFKGSGFYRTDSRSGSSESGSSSSAPGTAEKPAAAVGDGAKKTEKKTEKKDAPAGAAASSSGSSSSGTAAAAS